MAAPFLAPVALRLLLMMGASALAIGAALIRPWSDKGEEEPPRKESPREGDGA
jgi:hypothetical protein